MSPSVSVLVPTYNRPARLRECLSAIARQTFRDIETIVVNDGGVPVESVIGEFADLAPQLVNQTAQRGHVAARNRGIGIARGRYIALCDDDDVWLPDHLGDLV